MKPKFAQVVLVSFLLILSFQTATAQDIVPGEIEIVSLNGENPDQINELEISREPISLELEGVDDFDRPPSIEIGGESLTRIEEPETELRPRTDSEVSEGEQTLEIILDYMGDERVLAETQVDVTKVDLDDDDEDRPDSPVYDPEDVEISKINGEDADQVNELDLTAGDTFSIELEGLEEMEVPLNVEIDGKTISMMEKPDEDIRPRSDADVSEGEHSLELLWESRGESYKIGETEVDVTEVDLQRGLGPDVEPEDVVFDTLDGEEAQEVNELEVRYNSEFDVELEGIDVTEYNLQVELDGELIGVMREEDFFRPRTDSGISEGEKTLSIVHEEEEKTVLAETEVDIVDVELDPGEVHGRDTIDAEEFEVVSLQGEPAEDLEELVLSREPFPVEIDGPEFPDMGFRITIEGETVSIIEDHDDDVRPRSDVDVDEGEQRLEIVHESGDERDLLFEKDVEVIKEEDFEREEGPGDPPEELEFEIVSVNGEEPEETVTVERDLRGETPLDLEIEGLDEVQGFSPHIYYKEEFYRVGEGGYELDGDTVNIDHLPRVEEGEVETLKVVLPFDEDDYHVYDSLEIEFLHVEDETPETDHEDTDENGQEIEDDRTVEESGEEQEVDGEETVDETVEEEEGGIMSGVIDLFTGDEEETVEQDGEQEDTDEDGGLLDAVISVFGL